MYGARPNIPDYMVDVPNGDVYRIISDHLGSVVGGRERRDGAIVQELTYDS